jgi:hypothetical protein
VLQFRTQSQAQGRDVLTRTAHFLDMVPVSTLVKSAAECGVSDFDFFYLEVFPCMINSDLTDHAAVPR